MPKRADDAFDTQSGWDFAPAMTAIEVMKQIESLPPGDQAEVIRFAYRLDAKRQLTGPELSALAERMIAAENPAEAALLRTEIARGFYGGAHA